MKPMRISCRCQNIVGDGRFPIDGILAYQWMVWEHPEVLYGDSVLARTELIEAELPLERRGQGDGWYWAASFCQAIWAGEGRDYWNKRFDVEGADLVDFGKRRGKVIVEQGRYRSYHMPLFYLVPAGRLVWYAVGDLDAVAGLLADVSSLGKKRSQGWGIVDDWQIEPWQEDWSVWGSDGQLMRAVPADEIEGLQGSFDLAYYGLRPPYWHSESQQLVAIEGRRDEIKKVNAS